MTVYREQAIIERKSPTSHIFSYYVNEGKERDSYYYCPVCKRPLKYWFGDYQEGLFCYPTKRVVVKGFWFWRKKCPLLSIHRHFKCRECNAISIVYSNTDEPKPESALL